MRRWTNAKTEGLKIISKNGKNLSIEYVKSANTPRGRMKRLEPHPKIMASVIQSIEQSKGVFGPQTDRIVVKYFRN